MTALQIIDTAEGEVTQGSWAVRRKATLVRLAEYGYACPACHRLLAVGAACPQRDQHIRDVLAGRIKRA